MLHDMINSKRPTLDLNISIKDFQDYYWLKAELVNFCRDNQLGIIGSKHEITQRIIHFLKTGSILKTQARKRPKLPGPTGPLNLDTILGVDYRSYKEKKLFLQSHIGKSFHFTQHLLKYFELNTEKKTYADLVGEWTKEQTLKHKPNYKKEIDPQFEYNTYIRDFMMDNPGKKIKDAIQCWKLKKQTPGNRKYAKSDLLYQ